MIITTDVGLKTTVPLLVAPGDQDVVISPHTAREITADRAPNSSMNVFTGCGHLPPAEDPDAVARALNDFATGGKR